MPKTTTIPAEKPAKPSDKDQLLAEARELIVSMRRQIQEANDAATSGWLNRYFEVKKQGA